MKSAQSKGCSSCSQRNVCVCTMRWLKSLSRSLESLMTNFDEKSLCTYVCITNGAGGVPDGSFKRGPMLMAAFTVLSSSVISVMNMVLAFHQYSSTKVIGFNSVSLPLNWVLATVVSFYSVRTRVRENKKFPLVLILWWVFSSLVDVLSLFVRVVKDFEVLDLWFFLSEDNLVASFSLPLLVVLCFNVCRREHSDMEEGLLQIEEEFSMEEHDEEAFTNASVWNKLIFRWLNPIFKMGRVKKLELPHIPLVPCSESAESASSMLEGSLRKQKLGEGSLAKAIADSVWKSLALNAVLVGIFYILFSVTVTVPL
ncbi:ABC transporter C family member 9 isoform X4 [Vigna angularis]|uniref:ABC transporter C family member 9 isoform X4 n=1 Tax=Phaseolus angularis TaxID=3914 RepID=UPI0022B2DA0E|nr:ABC transporter C family member 9 isoform X4 [Vigna angularis]